MIDRKTVIRTRTVADAIVASARGAVAQWIERRFPKPCVGGSSPLSPTPQYYVHTANTSKRANRGYLGQPLRSTKAGEYPSLSSNISSLPARYEVTLKKSIVASKVVTSSMGQTRRESNMMPFSRCSTSRKERPTRTKPGAGPLNCVTMMALRTSG